MTDKIFQLLSILARYLWKEKKPPLAEIKKIMVLRLDHIGDVLLVTPLLRTLRKHLPNAHISIAAGSWATGILEGNPDVDEIVVFDYPRYNRNHSNKSRGNIAASLCFIRKIRQGGYDLVIDPRSNLSTLIFTYLSGARYKVGFDIGGRGFALTTKVPENQNLHQIEKNLLLAKAIGIETTEKTMVLAFSDTDKQVVEKFSEENGISKNDVLTAISPGAPWPPRRWDIGNFAEVIRWITKETKSKILIIGGKEDADVRDNLKKQLNGLNEKIVDCVGKITLKQTALLLQQCKFYLGTDSAPMHIAAAMGTPVIALMGPGEYPRFAPYGDNHIVIRKEVGCNPCRQNSVGPQCRQGINLCMKQITVDEVKNVISRLLNLNN